MQFNWKLPSLGCCLLLVAVFACAISFVVGGIYGQMWIYDNRYHEERGYVEERIKGNLAFSDVTMTPLSNGGVMLRGQVPTEDDLELLRSEVIRAIGEPRSGGAMGFVEVRP